MRDNGGGYKPGAALYAESMETLAQHACKGPGSEY